MTLPGKKQLNLEGSVISNRYFKELSSIALGGKIVSVSDEFFAEASQLLLVEVSGFYGHSKLAYLYDTFPSSKAPPNLKGQFGPKGALFSGWETRRHNADHDW